MSFEKTLYWHDYETFGISPKIDRPVQFAGLRTDYDLNPIGDPLVIYCKPAADRLPHPEACLVTGITPQTALQKGVVEAEFIGQIHEQIARPGTCTVGYNNLRFDDEVTRYTLYRNFFDPYGREWQNGNSRWDIIDMVRLTYALRPQGIEWPKHDDGSPSFRLEQLTVANGIAHQSAHDALSDVHATIAMARLVRSAQPRLYDFVFRSRTKRAVADLLDLQTQPALLHTSSRYPGRYGCTAIVMALASHPKNRNSTIVFDLRYDPQVLADLSADQIRERLYTASEDLPEGVDRIPLKEVHANRCPILVPLKTMDHEAAGRLQINLEQSLQHRQQLLSIPGLKAKLNKVFEASDFPQEQDPDLMLYDGFFSDSDRVRIEQIRKSTAEELQHLSVNFEDRRLPELLFRYRARNYPDSLSEQQLQQWRAHCLEQLDGSGGEARLGFDDYQSIIDKRLNQMADDDPNRKVLMQLKQYGRDLRKSLEV